MAVLACGLVGCGSGQRSTSPDGRADLLSASRAAWQAVLQHDPRAFCAYVAPEFSASLISALAKNSTTGGSCTSAMASRITDPGLTDVARIELEAEDPRWLKSVRVDGDTAVLTFADHKFSLAEVEGQSGGAMGVVEPAETVRVWLSRASDGEWQLSARNRITLAE